MKSLALPSTLLGAALACSVSLSTADDGVGERLVFETSAPELIEQPDWAPGLLSSEQYSGVADSVRGRDQFVIIQKLPGTELPLVGYGVNFVIGEINRGYAVFGEPQAGYLLYADVDADGSLADEEGWRLEQEREGRYSVAFDTIDTGQAGGRPVEFSIRSRFVIFPGGGDDADRARGVWNSETVRRGEVQIEGRHVPFELYGQFGRYDDPNQSIWFDLDADGAGGESRESPERFRILDEYVNIGDRSYAFRVDPFGRHLTLIPEGEARPDRPSLTDGGPAPGFQATAIGGPLIALSDYEGSFVLLNFWAAWCGPCRDEAPRLAEIHESWGKEGLQVVGITTDSQSTIEAFVSEYAHSWPQISEAFEGAVHRAYRVGAYPTKYLIDRNGDLLCGGAGPSFWEDCWPKAEAVLRSRAIEGGVSGCRTNSREWTDPLPRPSAMRRRPTRAEPGTRNPEPGPRTTDHGPRTTDHGPGGVLYGSRSAIIPIHEPVRLLFPQHRPGRFPDRRFRHLLV